MPRLPGYETCVAPLPAAWQVDCDCGAPAVVRVPILQISARGVTIYAHLNLCAACYAEFVAAEPPPVPGP